MFKWLLELFIFNTSALKFLSRPNINPYYYNALFQTKALISLLISISADVVVKEVERGV